MVNSARKGLSKERLCRNELEKEGWLIVFQSVRTRWACYDLADLFDVVAVTFKDGIRWKFISVKNYASFKNLPKHQEEILAFKNTYGLAGMEFEVWFWLRGHWKGRNPNKIWCKPEWKKIII
jgi:hypothetical protein